MRTGTGWHDDDAAGGPGPQGIAPERAWTRPVSAVLGAVVILASFFADPGSGVDLRDSALGWTAIAAAALVPLLRLPWPRAVGASGAVLSIALFAVGAPVAPAAVLLAIALYTFTKRLPPRGLAIGTALAGAIVVIVVGAVQGQWALVLPALLFVGLATAAADGARVRTVYFEAVHDHLERMEAGREAQARQRVVEERLRIARDLHDALAHQVAVINLHSGAASRALEDRPADAERSLATIRQAARTVLEEMGGILSVLRGPEGEGAEPPSRRPVGTLDDLGELLAGFAATGLRVRAEPFDEVLPETVSMVAYRVVQEGLANAHKHGDGHEASLRLVSDGDALTVELSNPAPSRRADAVLGSGHGLIGLGERVAAAGGAVEAAGIEAGRFRLLVRLPLGSAAADARDHAVEEAAS